MALSIDKATSVSTFGAGVNVSAGNVGIGVIPNNTNGGVLQLKSGITFPTTAVASTDANTLDDYEEGTFTPSYESLGATWTTYYEQVGWYTKIGRAVTIVGRIRMWRSAYRNSYKCGICNRITIYITKYIEFSNSGGNWFV